MRIETEVGCVEVIDEPTYRFGSTDNVRHYQFAKNLTPEWRSSAVHGVLLNDQPLAVFGASAGSTALHSASALLRNGYIFLAVGNKVVSFRPDPFEFKWQLQVDMATCFGVHCHESTGALISHGELEICRFSESGQILWAASGADIFSEGMTLLADCIEVVDFNHKVYHFDYITGSTLQPT